MTLTNAHYINTTPCRDSMFSPPGPVEDYKTWFIERYQRSVSTNNKEPCFGIAQRVNSIIYRQVQNGTATEIYTHGPYAGPAAEAIMEISNGQLQVEVLG